MNKYFLLFNCLAGLMLGFVFYLLFDNTTVVTKVIYELLGYDKPILISDNVIIGVIRSYGLDFIWSYSMWFGVMLCSFGFKNKVAIAVIVTIICGIVIELMQCIGLFQGTADLLDVLFEAAGTFAAVGVSELYMKKGDKK